MGESIERARAGIRWDSGVKKVWKSYRRKPRRDTVHREVCGYTTEVKEMIEPRERLALGKKVKEEDHLRDLREVKRRKRNENVCARPNGLRVNAETAI